MIVDYFVDVCRVRGLHQISDLNYIKNVSYTSYWLLKAKPIQIVGTQNYIADINEKFVLMYILDYISNDEKNILDCDEESLKSFREHLLYFLKYRIHSQYDIELMLLAFFAGQIYQSPEMDKSLPPRGDVADI